MAATNEVHDQALVLKTHAYGESDLVVHVLLEHGGRRTLFARSARRSKRRFRGGLPSFARLSVRYTEGRGGRLGQLRDSEVSAVWHKVAADLDRMGIGFHTLEIVQTTLEEGQGAGALFERLLRYLAWLDEETRGPAHLAGGHLRMQLLLLHEAGLLFDLERSTRSGRRLVDAEGLVFAADEGFFAADERVPGDHATWVRREVLIALQHAAVGTFSVDLKGLRGAQTLLNEVWTHLAGRELKSWSFLREASGF